MNLNFGSYSVSNRLAQACLQKISAESMLLHPWEQEGGVVTSKRLLLWQYLPVRTLASRHVGFVRTHHAFLAKMAWLNACISWNPRPPFAFCFVRSCQEIQLIFLFWSHPSHQNLVKTDWILLHKLAGSWKQERVYVGIAWKTDLSIVILPALESCLEDQLCALCWILSTMTVKRSFSCVQNALGAQGISHSLPLFGYKEFV